MPSLNNRFCRNSFTITYKDQGLKVGRKFPIIKDGLEEIRKVISKVWKLDSHIMVVSFDSE